MTQRRDPRGDASTGRDTILVTGGTGAIGAAIVELMADTGQAVAFTYLSGEDRARRLEETTSGRAVGFQLDLVDRAAVVPLIERVETALGPVAGLVNAAGIQRSQLLAMTSDAAWDEVVELNLGAVFRCCRAVVRGMVCRRHGAIVNVASLSALHGIAGLSAYAASKAGILALTRCLAREVGKRGIRVNAVMPGFVPSAMTKHLPEAAIANLRAGECLPGGTTPGAVAEVVRFLLSERASAVTGQAWTVDSGTSA